MFRIILHRAISTMPSTTSSNAPAAAPRKLIDYTQRGKKVTQSPRTPNSSRRRSSADISILALFDGTPQPYRIPHGSSNSIPSFLELSSSSLDAHDASISSALECEFEEERGVCRPGVAGEFVSPRCSNDIRPRTNSTKKHSFIQSVLSDLPPASTHRGNRVMRAKKRGSLR